MMLALLALLAQQAFALPLSEDDFAAFVAKSKAEPSRLYVLKVGTTWCGFCTEEAKELRQYSSKARTAVGRAYWSEAIVDKEPLQSKFPEFRKQNDLGEVSSYPFHVVFKGGKPIGHLVGGGMDRIEKFLGEAEAVLPGGESEAGGGSTLIPKFPCPQRDGEGVCIVGVSGYEGEKKHDTDDFGRANLKSFAALFKSPKFAKLFSPAVPKMGSRPSSVDDGVFYIRNPFLNEAGTFNDPKTVNTEVGKLAELPGKQIRMLMTGHGGQNGMAIGYQRKPDEKYADEVTLDAEAVENGVRAARAKGKTVKAVVVQCYGGQYAEAFMPVDGKAETGCAAFASLPEKTSEGCYSSKYTGERDDYVGVAIQKKKCDGQTARDLHYEIVAQAKGHDVPMLSSEYFLLFGSAAKAMARQKTAPAPPYGIVRVGLPTGPVVFIDRVNNRVIKAVMKGKTIPSPLLSVVNCTSNEWGWDWWSADHVHASFFYLHQRSVGKEPPKVGDCRPTFRFTWPKRAKFDATAVLGGSGAFVLEWGEDDPAGFIPLGEKEKSLDVSALKPEARLLLSKLLPAVEDQFTAFRSRPAGENIRRLAERVRSLDPARADAMLKLESAVAAYHKAKDIGSYKVGDLVASMLSNLSGSEVRESAAPRLAHLVAASLAELELRKAAATDPEAAKLLKQFEALKECEKDIL